MKGLVTLSFILVVGFISKCTNDQVISSIYGTSLEFCKNCNYVDKGRIFQTDANGVITKMERCWKTSGGRAMCKAGKYEMSSFIPDVTDVCEGHKIICYNPEPVSVWGDSRSDPTYIGEPRLPDSTEWETIRDWHVEDFRIMARRGGWVPAVDRLWAAAANHPDISAYSGHGLWEALVFETSKIMPLEGTNTQSDSDVANWPSSLIYKNNNKKLIIYAGVNDHSKMGDWFDLNHCDIACSLKRAYTYLATHGNVRLTQIYRANMDNYVTNIYPIGYNTTQENAIYTQMNGLTGFSCTNRDTCFHNLKASYSTGSGLPAFTICSRTEVSKSNNYFCKLAPTTRVDLLLPVIANSRAVLKLNHEFKTNIFNPYTYIMGAFTIWAQNTIQQYGFMDYFEESIDGTQWTPIPESMSSGAYQAWLNNDIPGIFTATYTDADYPCTVTSRISCRILVTNTGKNKYIRQVTLVAQGADLFHPSKLLTTGTQVRWNFSPVMFTAETLEKIDLYITPSTHPTVNLVPPFEVCNEVPNCHYVPSSYGNNYPTGDGRDSLHGSTTVRNHMGNELLPEVYGECEPRIDPVVDFMNLGRPSVPPMPVGTSFCDKTSQTEYTCYNVTAFAAADSHTTLEDSGTVNFGRYTVGKYHKNGKTLTVSKVPITSPPGPAIAAAIGNLNIDNNMPLYYVYTTPVPNSRRHKNHYFTTAPICSWNPTGQMPPADTDNLPLSTVCECSDVYIEDDCLCKNFIGYRTMSQQSQTSSMVEITEIKPKNKLVTALEATNIENIIINKEIFDIDQVGIPTCDAILCIPGNYECANRNQPDQIAICQKTRSAIITLLKTLKEDMKTLFKYHNNGPMRTTSLGGSDLGFFETNSHTIFPPWIRKGKETMFFQKVLQCGIQRSIHLPQLKETIHMNLPEQYKNLTLSVTPGFNATQEWGKLMGILEISHNDVDQILQYIEEFCLDSSMTKMKNLLTLLEKTHQNIIKGIDVVKNTAKKNLIITTSSMQHDGSLHIKSISYNPIYTQFNISNAVCVNDKKYITKPNMVFVTEPSGSVILSHITVKTAYPFTDSTPFGPCEISSDTGTSTSNNHHDNNNNNNTQTCTNCNDESINSFIDNISRTTGMELIIVFVYPLVIIVNFVITLYLAYKVTFSNVKYVIV